MVLPFRTKAFLRCGSVSALFSSAVSTGCNKAVINSMNDLRGKAVLIPGGTMGIGLATGLAFARQSAHCTLTRKLKTAKRQFITCEKVANAVLALCSGPMDDVSGQVPVVDRGALFFDYPCVYIRRLNNEHNERNDFEP